MLTTYSRHLSQTLYLTLSSSKRFPALKLTELGQADVAVPILQMTKLRPSEVEQFVKDHALGPKCVVVSPCGLQGRS